MNRFLRVVLTLSLCLLIACGGGGGNSGSSTPPPPTISVTFAPKTTGNSTGTLSITDNAADSPQIVSLSGKGVTCQTAGEQCGPSLNCCVGLSCDALE